MAAAVEFVRAHGPKQSLKNGPRSGTRAGTQSLLMLENDSHGGTCATMWFDATHEEMVPVVKFARAQGPKRRLKNCPCRGIGFCISEKKVLKYRSERQISNCQIS